MNDCPSRVPAPRRTGHRARCTVRSPVRSAQHTAAARSCIQRQSSVGIPAEGRLSRAVCRARRQDPSCPAVSLELDIPLTLGVSPTDRVRWFRVGWRHSFRRLWVAPPGRRLFGRAWQTQLALALACASALYGTCGVRRRLAHDATAVRVTRTPVRTPTSPARARLAPRIRPAPRAGRTLRELTFCKRAASSDPSCCPRHLAPAAGSDPCRLSSPGPMILLLLAS
jgi:hypothetical protein